MGDPSTADFSLRPGATSPSPGAVTIARSASAADGFGLDIARTLEWVRSVGSDLASQGTTARWEGLAAVASVDVAGARMLEPHVDALEILLEASLVTDTVAVRAEVEAGVESTWGVFAAEGHGVSLTAREVHGSWTLSGTKPWCSLAAHLSHALVTAWTSPDERRLFAVDLRARGVRPHDGPWVSRGLAQVVSAPVDFDDAVATPVGDAGWYQRRPAFAWGGVGVAAVWWGAVLPISGALVRAASREDADQLAATYAGEADAATWAARAALADAGARADEGPGAGQTAPEVIAHRARAIVAASAECVLSLADRALGPGPLATDEAFARRVGDIRIYLRQHHAERDLARLGRRLGAS